MSTRRPSEFPRLPDEGFVRADFFRFLLGGISRSTFYERIRSGAIPKPIKIATRASGWPVETVRDTIRRIKDKAEVST